MAASKVFVTLALLLICVVYGQVVTPSPTVDDCTCESYESYTFYNGTKTLATPAGCDNVNVMCTGCASGTCQLCSGDVCTCYDDDTNGLCNLAEAVAAAIGTVLIVVIVIASCCGLCIIISIAYCICAGALCCAAASNANKGTSGTQMA